MNADDSANATERERGRTGADRLVTASSAVPPWLGTGLPIALVALTAGMAALAYPTMPERMALHWRVGLDGTVRAGTIVPRIVGTGLLAAVAVAVLVTGLVAVRRLREREPTAATLCEVLLVVALAVVAAAQALVLGLNAG